MTEVRFRISLQSLFIGVYLSKSFRSSNAKIEFLYALARFAGKAHLLSGRPISEHADPKP
jgi:hypothetical protein